jgi:hypothetical protein
MKSRVPPLRLLVATVEDGLEFVPPRTNRHRGDLGSVGKCRLGHSLVPLSNCLIHTARRDTHGIAAVRDASVNRLSSERRCPPAGTS